MKPILFATARSGSTVIAELLGKITMDLWNGKGYLGEVFSIWPDTPNSLIEDSTGLTLYHGGLSFNTANREWRSREINNRIEVLKGHPDYLVKILADQYHPCMHQWIKGEKDVIFLERRNKLNQLLSLMSMLTPGHPPHFKINDNAKVNQILYEPEHVETLLRQLDYYENLRNTFDGPVLYYEDWQVLGSNEEALCKMLNLDNYLGMVGKAGLNFKETPYLDDPEKLIINQSDWINDRPYIIDKLKKYETSVNCNSQIG